MVYYALGGTVAAIAIGTILVKCGIWIGGVNHHKSDVATFMREIRDRLDRLFERLPSKSLEKGSPLRLSELGSTISERIKAADWATKTAPDLIDRAEGKQPYEIQDLCRDYVHKDFCPDDEMDAEIKASAYENGIDIGQVFDANRGVAGQGVGFCSSRGSQSRCGDGPMSFRCHTVIDGDTFDVTPNWSSHGRIGSRVRVANVNAPELGAPGGYEAKRKLEQHVLNKDVILYGQSISYGRLVAQVVVDGLDLGALLRAG